MRYWLFIENAPRGPFELEQLAGSPRLTPDVLVCPESAVGGSDWIAAKDCAELKPLLVEKPARAPAAVALPALAKPAPAGVPCPKCSALLPPDSAFCNKCGAPLRPAGPEEAPIIPEARLFEAPKPAPVPTKGSPPMPALPEPSPGPTPPPLPSSPAPVPKSLEPVKPGAASRVFPVALGSALIAFMVFGLPKILSKNEKAAAPPAPVPAPVVAPPAPVAVNSLPKGPENVGAQAPPAAPISTRKRKPPKAGAAKPAVAVKRPPRRKKAAPAAPAISGLPQESLDKLLVKANAASGAAPAAAVPAEDDDVLGRLLEAERKAASAQASGDAPGDAPGETPAAVKALPGMAAAPPAQAATAAKPKASGRKGKKAAVEACAAPSFMSAPPKDPDWYFGAGRGDDAAQARAQALVNLSWQAAEAVAAVLDESEVEKIAGAGRDRVEVANRIVELFPGSQLLTGLQPAASQACGGVSYALLSVQRSAAHRFLAEDEAFKKRLAEALAAPAAE